MPTTQEIPTTSPIGRDTPRVDGPLKVSGKAQYTSDFHFPGTLYAVPVEATIANGKVVKLDTAAAEKMPGVRAIFHRENIGKIFRSTAGPGFEGICEERRPPFEDDVVRYYGQYIALAVADTFEAAKAAADAVRVTYAKDKPNVETDLKADGEPDVVATTFGMRHRLDSQRGDAEPAFAAAPVKVDETYVTPAETHNPIELHATTAIWDGSTLTLYESSQGVVNLRGVLAQMFGLPNENVRVITKFVGSGFGGKLWPWTQCALAAAAARQLGKPVKLVLSRKMMFQSVGHRARTQQRVRLGATPDGKLVSLQHDYVYQRSMLDGHHEDCGEATPFQYSVPNLRVTFGRAKRNIGAAADMRGPGAVPGLYATESAMNELADRLKIDPVKLRVINEPKIDEGLGLPFSSRHLLECFELGAEKFGWSKRTPEIGSMKRDGLILGWGMAGCAWLAARFPAEASVQLRDDGTARVACATQDIGTGTYTILAQLTSQKTGIPLDKIEAVLGDTSLPEGPLSGGSMATGSVVPAVFQAADNAIASLRTIATTTPGSPFEKRKPDELAFEGGRVFVKADGAAGGVPFADLLQRANLRLVTGSGKSEATFGNPKPKFSTHSFGCHFVEVTWQPEIARLRVSRVVTVIDAGRIINPLAGRNQIEGAVVMGIGMALLEHTTYDPQNGAPINSNLADYVMAVNADAPPIEVHFLDFPDKEINELGARGIGEIGLAGIAAAITSAIHHATGVRVRELPVKIENLLA
ncbi:MAG TPA: xanthine dehydrogenase family protein molybdopterin-binding subunit [Candidatus Binatia bacterium]|jgi:xanthine dehydrogenase YagR molybdenum-binding subunit|nr:xanthine dehydrogenase family protein molybdopterin-binding subunit [Candidatus Binatia bacterium]